EEVAKDPQALSRFRREAKAASALNHPNICTLYDIGEQDGQAFIAMEFLDGATLKHRIAGKPVEADVLLVLAIEIAEGPAAPHGGRGHGHGRLHVAGASTGKRTGWTHRHFSFGLVLYEMATGKQTFSGSSS